MGDNWLSYTRSVDNTCACVSWDRSTLFLHVRIRRILRALGSGGRHSLHSGSDPAGPPESFPKMQHAEGQNVFALVAQEDGQVLYLLVLRIIRTRNHQSGETTPGAWALDPLE